MFPSLKSWKSWRAGRLREEGVTGLTGQERCGRTSHHPVMKTSGITAALPAQDLGRAKTFYVEKWDFKHLSPPFSGQETGRWASWLEMVQPAPRLSRPGQVVRGVHAGRHPCGRRARAVEEMRGRGVEFEEYDTPETRTENGVARMPGGGEAAWFKDSEGNLVGVVPA